MPAPVRVVRILRRPRVTPRRTGLAHQTFHCAPRYWCSLAVELCPHLGSAVHPIVVLVCPADLFDQPGVALCPRRRWAGLIGVVGGRGDPDVAFAQHPADRLDPEPVPILVDESHYFPSRGSSSRAKKADAAFKISFARRSSRFSRSNSTTRRR